MAVSSAVAAIVPLSNTSLPASVDPSRLCASRSLRFSPFHGFGRARVQSVSTARQLRILPKVEAKKRTFSSFDDLLENSDKPVLVDFYATWCGPCQFMVPILDQVSASLKDKVQIVKIDTEKYPSIASQYKIEALPTFIIFTGGNPCDRFEGALPADQLIQRIQSVLKIAK